MRYSLMILVIVFSAGYLSFSLAIDPSTGNIFYAGIPYTLSPEGYIGVVNPNTQKHFTVYKNDYDNIVSIALHPEKGWVSYI